MADHIFISYARADGADFAQKLHDALEARGFTIWLDVRDIGAGTVWHQEVRKAVEDCMAMIFLMTEGSYNSRVCQLEWGYALENRKPLYTVRLDDHKVYWLLRDIEYTDFRSEFDAPLEKLVTALSKPEENIAPLPPVEASRPGAARADLYDDADDLSDADLLPDTGLYGRDDLIARIPAKLQNGTSRLLLQGFGGAGKTTLAAKVAYDWLANGGSAVLWQRLGASDADALYEALAHPFGEHPAVAAARTTEDKRKILRALLKAKGVSLVVLDDAWNEDALYEVQRAVPTSVPLLVTSRHKSGIFGADGLIEVPDLPEDDALALLRRLAGTLAEDEAAARELVREVGNLAFAVEVAGRTMAQHTYTAREFLAKVQAETIANYEAKFGGAGRESVAKLIQASVDALPPEAQAAYRAWGAFWSPSLTPEMLALYAEADDAAAESAVGARSIVPLQDPENALNHIARSGLALRIPAQTHPDGRPQTVSSYRLHDLAYAYSRDQAAADSRDRALAACLAYTERYNEPSLENFAALVPELDNFSGAAQYAYTHQRWQDAERFAWNLYANSKVLDYRGYYTLAQTLLAQAASAAEQRGAKDHQGRHLGNLGLAYAGLGQYEQAIEHHQQALAIAEEIGDVRSKGNALGNLGNACIDLGQYEQAIGHYQQALAIHREIGDRFGHSNSLGNLGVAYFNLGQYEQAIEHYQQALAISREIGDRRGEGAGLGNLGLAYADLGQYEQAIEHYQQALAIAEEIGDVRNKGSWLGSLGNTYNKFGQYEQAIEHHQQALAIHREIVDRRRERNDLGNLGNAYFNLGQYEQAIEHYQQALAINREIRDRLGESNDLNNLGVAYEYLEDYDRALAHYEQALVLFRSLGVMHHAATVERNIEDAKRKRDGG